MCNLRDCSVLLASWLVLCDVLAACIGVHVLKLDANKSENFALGMNYVTLLDHNGSASPVCKGGVERP